MTTNEVMNEVQVLKSRCPLVSIRELRARCGEVDTQVLELVRSGRLWLSRHDYPAAADPRGLLWVEGKAFNAVGVR